MKKKEKIKYLLKKKRLVEKRKYTYEEIADMVGCSRSYVYLVNKEIADKK